MARPYKRRAMIAPETNATKTVANATDKQNSSPKVYDIDQGIFVTKGRGVPVNGYVLVAGLGVIDEITWESRLKTKCKHGYGGWKCIECNRAL